MPKTTNLYNSEIQRYIADLITSGKLKPGDRTPSERELAKQFCTSNTPVRQATDALVARGLLERLPGKGTFVRDPEKQQSAAGKLTVLYAHEESGFFGSSFYTAILRGVEQEANDRGKSLILRPLQRHANENPAATIRETAGETDGLIIIDMQVSVFARVQRVLKQLEKPVVLVNYEDFTGQLDAVISDNIGNTGKLTDFLVSRGHTKIGFASISHGPDDRPHPNTVRRLEGYRLGLLKHGMQSDDSLVVTLGPAGKKRIRSLVKNGKMTALIIPGDTNAVAFLDECADLGISIPDDLTVTGYMDIPESKWSDPPLTTLHVPLAEMGRLAVRRVMEKRPGDPAGITVCVPGEIVERKSHKDIP